MLWMMGREVQAQLASATPKSNNPLGRVLKVGASHMKETIDRLELKLAEAIMAERPSLKRYKFCKNCLSSSTIGRIAWNSDRYDCYFPTNNIIWTGDPKIMAGGISQALVTTVLGLVVAIPTTLAHSFLQSSARSVVDVLEEQATGIVLKKLNKDDLAY